MIDHISYVVSRADAEACAGFYALLGFERVEAPAGLGERSIWLRAGGASIHLVFADRDTGPVEESPPPGAGHVALVIDRYEARLAALEAAGVEVDRRSAYWGAARCLVRDPAGNVIELTAAPSG